MNSIPSNDSANKLNSCCAARDLQSSRILSNTARMRHLGGHTALAVSQQPWDPFWLAMKLQATGFERNAHTGKVDMSTNRDVLGLEKKAEASGVATSVSTKEQLNNVGNRSVPEVANCNIFDTVKQHASSDECTLLSAAAHGVRLCRTDHWYFKVML